VQIDESLLVGNGLLPAKSALDRQPAQDRLHLQIQPVNATRWLNI
jgi:hypothetical protein